MPQAEGECVAVSRRYARDPPLPSASPPALRGERCSELPYPNPNATAISAAAAEKFIV